MTDNGMFYRSISGNETDSVAGDKVDSYDVLTTNKSFSQILDDSTINSAGYWFLHKESSGRPVWTNINALGEYIDNRVNPDAIYIGWNDIELEYPERQLILIPPNENNTTGTIDPTTDTYLAGAYAWTEDGWSNIPPLMSRAEINERISEIDTFPPYTIADAGKVLTVNNDGDGLEWTDKGGGGGGGGLIGGSLKDFLSLFTANGAQAHYTNYGCYMQSEVDEDGRAYYNLATYGYNLYYVDENSFPDGLDPKSVGTPRLILSKKHDNFTTAAVTGISNYGTTTDLTATTRAVFQSSGNDGDARWVTEPIYIPLAPFTYLNRDDTNPDNPSFYNNVPRDWNIHFVIKGKGIFQRYTGGTVPPAWADVSVVLCDRAQGTNYDIDDYCIHTKMSKTYYITKGDAMASVLKWSHAQGLNESDTTNVPGIMSVTGITASTVNVPRLGNPITTDYSNVVTAAGGSSGTTAISTYTPATYPYYESTVLQSVTPHTAWYNTLEIIKNVADIRKEINFYESFSACEINEAPSPTSYYVPYLRVCVKGISSYNGSNSTDGQASANGLGIEIQSTLGSRPNIARDVAISGTDVFIEQFTDDRFMQLAYKYANGTLTRRLSYQDNLLGVNATNPASTTNTNILGN